MDGSGRQETVRHGGHEKEEVGSWRLSSQGGRYRGHRFAFEVAGIVNEDINSLTEAISWDSERVTGKCETTHFWRNSGSRNDFRSTTRGPRLLVQSTRNHQPNEHEFTIENQIETQPIAGSLLHDRQHGSFLAVSLPGNSIG